LPEPDPITVRAAQVNGAVVLNVTGEVDMLSAPELRTAFNQALVDSVGKLLVIDLSGVLFLGSQGLALLVETAKAAHAQQTRLRIVVGNSRAVRRSIQVSGLHEVLVLRDALDDALRG
jgi:anti-anti-sigma factor